MNTPIESIPALNAAHRGWESHQLTDLHAAGASAGALRDSVTSQLRDADGQRLAEISRNGQGSRFRVIDYTPENALRLRFLASVFPDARFVLIHRDARQNVSSILDAWQDPATVTIPSLPGWERGAWHCLLPPLWRDYARAPLMDVAALQWAAANEVALDDLGWVPADRWIAVDYADLVAWPSEVACRVLALAGLDADKALTAVLQQAFPLGGPPPSPIRWRSNRAFRETALARHNVLRGRLRELGGPSAAPPPDQAIDPKVRFACSSIGSRRTRRIRTVSGSCTLRTGSSGAIRFRSNSCAGLDFASALSATSLLRGWRTT